jgi:predicted outer membrane protein
MSLLLKMHTWPGHFRGSHPGGTAMRSVWSSVLLTAFVFAPDVGSAAAPSSMFAPAAAAQVKRMSVQQRAERQFLKDAAASSRFDTEAARMALAKSSDPDVRAFAATLINHHTNAGNELQRMLHSRGMAPPMLGNEQRKTLNRLAKLQGARFDRQFLEEVGLRYQQDDVSVFEKAASVSTEPLLREWIGRNLPTLRYHLTQAEKIAPADIRLARSAAVPVTVSTRAQPHPSAMAATTKSMGAGPAPVPTIFDDGQPGAQMGLARPTGMTQLGVVQMGVKH